MTDLEQQLKLMYDTAVEDVNILDQAAIGSEKRGLQLQQAADDTAAHAEALANILIFRYGWKRKTSGWPLKCELLPPGE